jgi:hypothetical protein
VAEAVQVPNVDGVGHRGPEVAAVATDLD